MAVFLISYDLVKEPTPHDYQPLWDELEDLDGVRTQLSAWYVTLNNTQSDVYEHFLPFMDRNDRLNVITVTQKPSYNQGLKGTRALIETNFP